MSGAGGANLSTGSDHKIAAHFATHVRSKSSCICPVPLPNSLEGRPRTGWWAFWQRVTPCPSISGRKGLRLVSCQTVKRVLCALLCAGLFAQRAALAKGGRTSARLELAQGPGTEQCVDQQSLTRAVEARLQRRVFRTDTPATLYVKIAIARQGAGWSASLTMHDGTGAFLGRRSIVTEAAHCSALDEALALVVALLVDSPPLALPANSEAVQAAPANGAQQTVAQAVPTSPPARAEANEPPSEERLAIRLPRNTPAPREPWRLQLAAEGSAALGMLPGFTPGVELGFGAKAPRLPELRLFAGWYAQREQRRSGLDAGARFDFAFLGLELCPLEHQLGIVHWSACAGQSLGRLRAASFGFDENLTSNHLTYALLVRTGVQIALSSRWAARLGIRAELPLARGVFVYGARDGGQPGLFETTPVTAVFDLGLVVNL